MTESAQPTPSPRLSIGAAIRKMRETLGLKLELVAIDAGFDPGNLSRIETDKQKPSIGRLEAIAKAMEVSVSDLYALVEPPRLPIPNPPPEAPPIYGYEWAAIRRQIEALDSPLRQVAQEFLLLVNRVQQTQNPPARVNKR
jgi:transcriptional regulator with XRE-family HTH domain